MKKTELEKSIMLISPEEDLAGHFSSEFKRSIFDLINSGNKKIIIDFERLTYVDSMGMGSLIAILKKLSSVGGILVVSGVTENIDKIFKMLDLKRFFFLSKTVQDAVDLIKSNDKSVENIEDLFI